MKTPIEMAIEAMEDAKEELESYESTETWSTIPFCDDLDKALTALKEIEDVDVEVIAKDIYESFDDDSIIAGKTIEGYQDIFIILRAAEDKGYLHQRGMLRTGVEPVEGLDEALDIDILALAKFRERGGAVKIISGASSMLKTIEQAANLRRRINRTPHAS